MTEFYIKAVTVFIPGVSNVKISIVKNGYNASIKNTRFIITDMLDTPAQDVVKKYLHRWENEVFFRDIKQYLCFEKVQVQNLKKLEGFFSMVFITFIFVQILKIQNNLNTTGETANFLQDFVQVKVNNVVYRGGHIAVSYAFRSLNNWDILLCKFRRLGVNGKIKIPTYGKENSPPGIQKIKLYS
ncbi:MAG: hypothetical protein PWQ70_1667 [Clostridiales bacterium]|nr:hypothetical protein [Clostridiales bacterium]